MKNTLCSPSRQKYWSEITPDERTERLRSELKRALRRIEELSATVRKLKDAAEVHEHGKDGKPVMPMLSTYGQAECDSPAPRNQTGDDVFI
jgi:predicted RNase H-like nuclease (RuvC/YqgF family)